MGLGCVCVEKRKTEQKTLLLSSWLCETSLTVWLPFPLSSSFHTQKNNKSLVYWIPHLREGFLLLFFFFFHFLLTKKFLRNFRFWKLKKNLFVCVCERFVNKRYPTPFVRTAFISAPVIELLRIPWSFH